MQKVAWGVGVLWISVVVAFGLWLGFAGLFLGRGGILFESGFGDIWVLAICGLPGYLLLMWGKNKTDDDTSN